ncbi:DUF3325 domain-containing protein [Sphingomonas sp. HF-S4]|uniref:DUF3325 domain-containing protein n=1 Tax=Sphingomonas agrestis TaxID=3080540 RepID=A0ABU3Y840_9SPHN|nr:DUF3325 domain-containing protein [Sphingomonas sp. HF-S4]MDV3457531.1 DUF3325 domain-containing protein [Sphingomonas sp. HF-S4]
MIAAGLLYLGLFAIAASMSRHAAALLGGWSKHALAPRLPAVGWTMVALSLVASLLTPDWPRALVAWFGLAPLTGGVVLLGLTFAPQAARASVVLALGLVVVGLAGLGVSA